MLYQKMSRDLLNFAWSFLKFASISFECKSKFKYDGNLTQLN